MNQYEKLGIIEGNKKPYSNVFIDQCLPLERATARYKKRREDFMKDLKYPAVVFSCSRNLFEKEVFSNFFISIYQEPLMLYLTGINQKEVAIYFNPITKREIWFFPKRNKEVEFWNGAMLGIGSEENENIIRTLTQAVEIFSIEDIFYILSDDIREHNIRDMGVLYYEGYDKTKKQFVSFKDSSHENKNKLKEEFEEKGLSITYHNILQYSLSKRLPLDGEDIHNIKRAIKIHREALQTVYSQVKSLSYEYEIQGILESVFIKNSPYGTSFPPIVGGGKNATCLHYNKNDDPLVQGELVLIDCGVRIGSMMSDVTRTIPLNGVFNPLQKIVYQVVLDTQKAVEEKVRAGIIWFDIDQWAWKNIQKDLKERMKPYNGIYKLSYDTKPHGLGHLMGEMVHDGDPYRNYQFTPLEEGVIMTNEPGLYGYFEATIDGVEYKEHIGVRIEDMLLVSKGGCINLSSSIEKEIQDIEGFLVNK